MWDVYIHSPFADTAVYNINNCKIWFIVGVLCPNMHGLAWYYLFPHGNSYAVYESKIMRTDCLYIHNIYVHHNLRQNSAHISPHEWHVRLRDFGHFIIIFHNDTIVCDWAMLWNCFCSYKWLVYSNSFSCKTSKLCIFCRLLMCVTSKRVFSLCTHRHGQNTYAYTPHTIIGHLAIVYNLFYMDIQLLV